jgi:hypothetical protein
MRLMIDNYLSLSASRFIENEKRARQHDPDPSQTMDLPKPNPTISARGSVLDFGRPQLSNALSTALALQGPSPSFNLRSNGSASFLAPLNLPADPRINGLSNVDEELRLTRTEGIGDRSFGVTNTTPVVTPKNLPLSTFDSAIVAFYSNKFFDNFSSPAQDEASKMRGAILNLAQAYVSTNPSATTTELQTAIDSHLGSGTADLFNVRVEDVGDGESQIHADQINYNDLSYDEQQTFYTAQFATDILFGNNSPERTLLGSDISQNLTQLTSLVGERGASLVIDLRNALSQKTDVQQTLNDFLNKTREVGYSSSDDAKIKKLVESLQNADMNVTNGFGANALVDDMTAKYTSGRYGNAWSQDQITETAALTENSLFLNK